MTLPQLPELILKPKSQLPQILNIVSVFARTPVLGVGDTNFKFMQLGVVNGQGERCRRSTVCG